MTPEDTGRVIEEFHRILVVGGTLILTTPHDEHLEEQTVECPQCEAHFHRWGHQQLFREEDFRKLAAAHRFSPLGIFPFRWSRVRKVRRCTLFLTRSLILSRFIRGFLRGRRGSRTLIMVARKM